MNSTRVEVAQVSGNTLDTRDEATKLFNFLQRNFLKKIIIMLSFEGVEFMSRSFADQFYQLKANWELQQHKSIKIESYNRQIAEILEAVSQTQYHQLNQRKIKTEITEFSFSEMDQFGEYLLGI